MSKAQALGADFDFAVYQQYANLDAKQALDQKHESWTPIQGFPRLRMIADNACISNSAQLRLERDISYQPGNLKVSSGKLGPSYTVVPILAVSEDPGE
jgi:hypothetical protein